MMKTAIRLKLLVLVSFCVLGLIGCQPAAPDTNRNTSAINAAPTPEPFDPAAIEAEVLRLDREWINAVKNRDAEAVRRILADDAVLTYPDGTTGSKAGEIRDTEAGNITADAFDVLETNVKVLNADAAVVTGRTEIRNGRYKRPDGRTINISGQYRFTDVFARRDGTWQVVTSQATTVDPQAAASAPPPAPSPAASASPSASTSP